MSDHIGSGEVLVTLDGTEYRLKPTLRAAFTVNDHGQGFLNVFSRVSVFDISTMVVVIAAGLGKTKPDELAWVREQVYATGPAALMKPVARFLECLAHGGREPERAPEGSPEGQA